MSATELVASQHCVVSIWRQTSKYCEAWVLNVSEPLTMQTCDVNSLIAMELDETILFRLKMIEKWIFQNAEEFHCEYSISFM